MKKNKLFRQSAGFYILWIAIIVLINVAAQSYFSRFDLTAEKRFSLNNTTKDLLRSLDEPVLVRVYLEGDFPSDFKRLQRETRQMLNEFKAYHRDFEVEFIDPNANPDPNERRKLHQQLEFKRMNPIRVEIEENGKQQRLQIFPGATMSYGEKEITVQLLSGMIDAAPERQINSAIQNLEYNLANGIRRLVDRDRRSIGFVEGHGELSGAKIMDLMVSLNDHYDVNRFNMRQFKEDSITGEISLKEQIMRLSRFDAIVVPKPMRPFTDLDKFLIDQYIMRGGKVVWLLDAVHADMDSLSESPEMLAVPILDELKLNDLLFRYGVRINTDLVQDMKASAVSDMRSSRPWIYFPLVGSRINHPISKDLNGIKLEFPSSIDTVMAPGVKKTVLLESSSNARRTSTPHIVRLSRLYDFPGEQPFPHRNVPMAYLLEGEFESLFANRVLPKSPEGQSIDLKRKSPQTAQVVVADGDIIRNQLNITNPKIERGAPLPLGYDQFTGVQYGNKDFLLNVFDYLLDDSGLISVRTRELRIRMLDHPRIREEKMNWIIFNTVTPIVLVLLIGILFVWMRKRKFAASQQKEETNINLNYRR